VEQYSTFLQQLMRKKTLISNRQEEADIHQLDSAHEEPMPNKILLDYVV
jgi:hypothetical protein